jgi:glycosyltransferase involved in cell wall biosynthesis
MRILHIISAPAAGGAEIYVKDLAAEMRKRGHEIFVLFLEGAADSGRSTEFEAKFLAALAVAGVGHGFIGHGSRRNPFAGVKSVLRHVRTFQPDVVHAHLFYGVVFSAFVGVPVVYTRHSIGLRVPKAVYRLLFDRIVDTYVGICAACTRVLQGATRRPVVRIDNGVSAERLRFARERSREKSAGLTLLAVGRLIPYKNYPLLLRALASLPSNLDWRLLVAGEGPEATHLAELSAELGIGRKVNYMGNVSDVDTLFADVDIFVMSSSAEGLPIALIEATLAGLPVIVTNVGGCAEVVHAVCNGLVVDDCSVPALSKALRRMMEDHVLRDSFSRNAIKYGGHYELDTAVRGHLELYASLAGRLSRKASPKDV